MSSVAKTVSTFLTKHFTDEKDQVKNRRFGWNNPFSESTFTIILMLSTMHFTCIAKIHRYKSITSKMYLKLMLL